MSQNYFRAEFQKRFSPDTTIKGTLSRYLQLHDRDPVHDHTQDVGGLIAIDYGDPT